MNMAGNRSLTTAFRAASILATWAKYAATAARFGSGGGAGLRAPGGRFIKPGPAGRFWGSLRSASPRGWAVSALVTLGPRLLTNTATRARSSKPDAKPYMAALLRGASWAGADGADRHSAAALAGVLEGVGVRPPSCAAVAELAASTSAGPATGLPQPGQKRASGASFSPQCWQNRALLSIARIIPAHHHAVKQPSMLSAPLRCGSVAGRGGLAGVCAGRLAHAACSSARSAMRISAIPANALARWLTAFFFSAGTCAMVQP